MSEVFRHLLAGPDRKLIAATAYGIGASMLPGTSQKRCGVRRTTDINDLSVSIEIEDEEELIRCLSLKYSDMLSAPIEDMPQYLVVSGVLEPRIAEARLRLGDHGFL